MTYLRCVVSSLVNDLLYLMVCNNYLRWELVSHHVGTTSK